MAMYERLKAKEAELAYNAAKGRVLKKLCGIRATYEVPVRQGGLALNAALQASLEIVS